MLYTHLLVQQNIIGVIVSNCVLETTVSEYFTTSNS